MQTVKLLLPLILALALPAEADKFYKWVDESGATHYTTTPPDNLPAQTVDVTTGKETSSTTDEDPQGKGEEEAGEETAVEDAEQKKSRREQALARFQQQNAENCEIARNNDFNLTHRNRIRVKDEDTGEQRYLTPEELTEWRSKTKSQLAEFCTP